MPYNIVYVKYRQIIYHGYVMDKSLGFVQQSEV
jgi:hypothetical protein